MHLYRLGKLTLYSFTYISLIRVPINRGYPYINMELRFGKSLTELSVSKPYMEPLRYIPIHTQVR